MFAVRSGKSGPVEATYATEYEASQHPQFGIRSNRVEAIEFKPTQLLARFIPIEVEWDLSVCRPSDPLDVPESYDLAGEHIGESCRLVTLEEAREYAAELNRQSLEMVRREVPSIPWTIVLELGQQVGEVATIDGGADGVYTLAVQSSFRVHRVLGAE